MPLSAFFRIIWRPAFGVLLLMSIAMVGLLYVSTLNYDMEASRHLDLSMLVIPLIFGMLVGQSVYDVRTRSFSWAVPGLHRKLGMSVICIALLFALAWTWAYRSQGGEMPVVTGFAGFLLVFMSFAALQPTGYAFWVVVLVALGSRALFESVRAQPIAPTVAAFLGAAYCFRVGFGPGSARRLLQSPASLVSVNLFNRTEVERASRDTLKRGVRSAPWHVSVVGTHVHDWVRAIEYGSLGAVNRKRSFCVHFAMFAIMGLNMLSVAFMNEGGTLETGLEHAFHILFVPPVPLENPLIMPIALFPAMWATGYVLFASAAFQPRWIYPVSRRQRSAVVYRMALRQNVLVAALLSLTFVGYGALIVALRGGVDDLRFMPGFLRAVIVISILLPLVQRFRLWMEPASFRDRSLRWNALLMAFVLAAFTGSAQILTHLWMKHFSQVVASVQVALIVALLLTSQALYRRVTTELYRRADLV